MLTTSRLRSHFVLGAAVVGLLCVLLYAGCSGGLIWTEGGWLSEGDDVIVVQAKGTTTRLGALRRTLRTFKEAELPIDTLHQVVGYVRTRPVATSGTSNVRLNVVVADSGRIEIAGEHVDTRSPTDWHRVSWTQGASPGSGPWEVMKEAAQAIGTIQDYEKDPLRSYDDERCGGRRCAEDEICQNSVCMAPDQRRTARTDVEACLSAEEQRLLAKIRGYRAERGHPRIPVSTALTRVARAHVRDLARNEPHKGPMFGKKACTLHSWSAQGPWSACCSTSEGAGGRCTRSKPRQATDYPGRGYEIAVQDVQSAAEALSAWRANPKDNALLVNEGRWRSRSWKAIGVGLYEGYAVAWVGTNADSTGILLRCRGGH